MQTEPRSSLVVEDGKEAPAMPTPEGVPEETKTIPRVTLAEMIREVRDYIAGETTLDHLWTDDWSPVFYRAQARLGFIAVAAPGPEGMGNVLLPELQHSYAVMDLPDLIVDRGVRRILESGRVEREEIRLLIDCDPEGVLIRLVETWGEKTWLVPEYVRLMQLLAAAEERAADPGFRLLATTLLAGDEPVAGELGYAVGRAYVSLSGFFRRERPEWNNFGKLQMVLLARRLEAAGFVFWNLGHPYMEYKTRLGARVVPRTEFLPIWDAASEGDVPDLGC
jgi:GNAT acetyltransferase-like protein